MRSIAILLLISTLSLGSVAQELNCRIQVLHRQVQGTNTQVFETLQTQLNELMNQTRWTNHVYNFDERIECNIVLNISEYSGDMFKGFCQVQSRRPVFGSSYNTVLLNYKEKTGDLHFRYDEGEPLIFNPNSSNHPLVATLAFYAYIVIGLDYDSFGSESGTQYFQQAQKIVGEMQNTPYQGWKSFESLRNRYWLAEDLLTPVYGPLRRCSYRYHRYGFDQMGDKLEQGRTEVAESLRLLQKVHRNKPNSFLVQLFFTAKSDEIVNLFQQSVASEKQRVFQIVSQLDPPNLEKYQKMKQ